MTSVMHSDLTQYGVGNGLLQSCRSQDRKQSPALRTYAIRAPVGIRVVELRQEGQLWSSIILLGRN